MKSMTPCAALSMAMAAAICALPAIAADCPGNPGAIGISRTVEIDTTGGPPFGLAQYKVHDFLAYKEIVLTFDDGPWPTTKLVLEALAHHCTKATFFTIGKHATYYPEVLKKVVDAGHTVGTHTWSHANLRGTRRKKMSFDQAKDEIEKGLSAVKVSMGQGAPAPFFRFPALHDTPELVAYLGRRNIAIFSMDVDAFDFKIRSSRRMISRLLKKLDRKGKGIVLLHDFQKHTAKSTRQLLDRLKSKGYKVVHMRAKLPAVSLPEYDKMVRSEFKGPMLNARPTSSVVKTVPSQ